MPASSARQKLLALGERLNADGLRVLAVAVRELPSVGEALAAAAALGGGVGTPVSGGASPRSLPATPTSTGLAGGDDGGQPSPTSPRTPPAGQPRAVSPFGGSAASLASTGVSFSAEDEEGMLFVGFLAFLDPPKNTARQAVAELQAKSGGAAAPGRGHQPPCVFIACCLYTAPLRFVLVAAAAQSAWSRNGAGA